MQQPYVVVGVGSESDANTALEWAAGEARSRRCGLEVVHAYHLTPDLAPWEMPTDRMLTDELRRTAETTVKRAVEHLKACFADVDVEGVAVDGTATHILVDRSRSAVVTVLGSRNLSAARSMVTGSVSATVAAAGVGPVVVVEGPASDPGNLPEVVVGIDGSDVGDDVLAFAFEHASRHGLPLRAVFCWPPDVLADAVTVSHVPIPDEAERWLAEAVAGWQEKFPDVTVQRTVVRAHPVAGLVSESSVEELLVVGARQRHARFAPLLGSVSQGVLHHATCPVALVHP